MCVKVLKDSQLLKTTCMTVDWIGRRIFIAQDTTMNTTLLFEIDLELKTNVLKKVVNPNSTVLALAMYPLLRYVNGMQVAAVVIVSCVD